VSSPKFSAECANVIPNSKPLRIRSVGILKASKTAKDAAG
jgi:hypothetical protein